MSNEIGPSPCQTWCIHFIFIMWKRKPDTDKSYDHCAQGYNSAIVMVGKPARVRPLTQHLWWQTLIIQLLCSLSLDSKYCNGRNLLLWLGPQSPAQSLAHTGCLIPKYCTNKFHFNVSIWLARDSCQEGHVSSICTGWQKYPELWLG